MSETERVRNNIFRNTTFLLISDIISKVFEFFFIIVTYRKIDLQEFGIYSYWLSLSVIISFIVDFGAGNLIVREVSIDIDQSKKFFSNTLILKFFLSIILIISSFLLMQIFLESQIFRSVGYIILISLVLKVFNFQLFFPFFRAYEKMGFQGIARIIISGTKLFLILISINKNVNVTHIAFIDLVSNTFALIFSFFILRSRFFHPTIIFNKKFSFYIIKNSIPFGITTIFIQSIDWIESTIFIILRNEKEYGLYSSAFKIIQPIFVFSVLLSAVVFPSLSKYYKKSPLIFRKIYLKYLKFIEILAFPLTFLILIYAREIMIILYNTEELLSIYILQLLAWQIILSFIYRVYRQTLEATQNQRFLMYISIACVFENIILNLLLIPTLGGIGMAIARNFSFLTLIIVLKIKIGKFTSIKMNKIEFLNILISCLLMSSLSLLIKNFVLTNFFYLNLILSIILSIILYVFLIVLLKILKPDELKMTKNSINNLIKHIKTKNNILK